MKRLGLGLAALALIASITGAFAANDRPLGTIRGQVSTIDAASGSLVIKLDGDQGDATNKEMSFFVSSEAKIVRGGASIALNELKEGDKVTVTYRPTDERNVVVNIGVEPRKT